jgi:hypothetical protein
MRLCLETFKCRLFQLNPNPPSKLRSVNGTSISETLQITNEMAVVVLFENVNMKYTRRNPTSQWLKFYTDI